MTTLKTLAADMAAAIATARRAIPLVDRLDRRPLMDLRDKLERYHAALTAEMQRPMDGPYGTNGCWGPNGRAPKIQDWIRQVEAIAKSSQRATSLPTTSSKKAA